MNKYMKRWISILLTACLLMALVPTALAEAVIAEGAEAPEVTVAPVEEVPAAEEVEFIFGDEPAEAGGEASDDVFMGEAYASSGSLDAAEDEILAEGADFDVVSVPVGDYAYAWTVNADNAVYRDPELTDPIYTLKASEAVLIVERLEGAARGAISTTDGVVEGYLSEADLRYLDEAETDALLDTLSGIPGLDLYGGDVDWPLAPEANKQNLGAADFTRLSNDQEFVVQGKTITARMVGNHSDCWSWARALYNIIWGVKFTNDFLGNPETGHNLIRNLNDSERQLTGENLKKFMKQSVVGCTLRIASCPLSCSNINNDGCPKHEKHSLIVVSIEDDGFVVMDNVTGNGTDRYDTRYYTYDNFAKHWAKYKMVKYIKWPNAPEYDKSRDLAEASIQPESVTLSETSLFIRAEETQAVTATVLPENANDRTVTWSSSDPFVAYVDDGGNLIAVSSGTATITATAANGVNAAMEVTVVPRDLKATGVSLDQSGTVYVNLGSTLQLNAAVEPAYANPEVKWKSSKAKVAKVDASGLVTPKKAGTTTITVVTASKKVAKVKVKVLKGNDAGKVTLDQTGTVTLNLGETLKLNATVTPANANVKLKWKSSKAKVAKVDSDGTVTPVSAGTATIAVVTSNKKTAQVKVKVVDANAPTGVALDKTGTVILKVGETLQLTPALTPDTAKTTYKWASSKAKVAKVDSNGLVTAKKVGTCTVAVATANKKVARVKIKVTK